MLAQPVRAVRAARTTSKDERVVMGNSPARR
jgi:hypothetical protein